MSIADDIAKRFDVIFCILDEHTEDGDMSTAILSTLMACASPDTPRLLNCTLNMLCGIMTDIAQEKSITRKDVLAQWRRNVAQLLDEIEHVTDGKES